MSRFSRFSANYTKNSMLLMQCHFTSKISERLSVVEVSNLEMDVSCWPQQCVEETPF